MTITFSRVQTDAWGDKRVAVYLDGRSIGGLYREVEMTRWAVEHLSGELEAMTGEYADTYYDAMVDISGTLAECKRETRALIREALKA